MPYITRTFAQFSGAVGASVHELAGMGAQFPSVTLFHRYPRDVTRISIPGDFRSVLPLPASRARGENNRLRFDYEIRDRAVCWRQILEENDTLLASWFEEQLREGPFNGMYTSP